MQIKMTVKGLILDPVSKMPIVVLRDEEGEKLLPIWIGFFEANAIAIELERVKTPRPMTHDLIKNIVDTFGASVQKIAITKLADSTYYALIALNAGKRTVEIDARPSDAIALALRFGSPIYVEEEVINKSKGMSSTEDEERAERIRKWLESLDPEELGKYEM